MEKLKYQHISDRPYLLYQLLVLLEVTEDVASHTSVQTQRESKIASYANNGQTNKATNAPASHVAKPCALQ
jgi:hypothetical protein